MTQQTKTVEMIAAECAIDVAGRDEYFDFDKAEKLIRQAISDAVKGSGAVEALADAIEEMIRLGAETNSDTLGENEVVKCAKQALRALTLPDQPNK